jgi:hypothetical protein
MTENMNITGRYLDTTSSASITEPVEAERREGAIRTALFVLASSLVLPMLHYLPYLWQ